MVDAENVEQRVDCNILNSVSGSGRGTEESVLASEASSESLNLPGKNQVKLRRDDSIDEILVAFCTSIDSYERAAAKRLIVARSQPSGELFSGVAGPPCCGLLTNHSRASTCVLFLRRGVER